jgi:16S rRNA (cytosine967-C5)-methyltransferase
VRWRRGPEDPARLAGLQAELLAAGARLLEPGGAVLYCTCTVTRAENQKVVAAALAAVPGLAPAWDREAAGPAAAAIAEDGFFHSLPHRHGTDAFFAARLARAA